jgi:hypothetical protein
MHSLIISFGARATVSILHQAVEGEAQEEVPLDAPLPGEGRAV